MKLFQYFVALCFGLWLSSAAWSKKPFIYGENQYIASYDPYTSNEITSKRLSDLLFNGLVRVGSGYNYEPDLLELWEIAKDQTKVKIMLRAQMPWHDHGAKPHYVTARDVASTIEILKNPASEVPNVSVYSMISNVQIIDDRNAVIHFDRPIKDPLRLLMFKVLPASSFPQKRLKRTDDFVKNPIGTGPYKFVKAHRDGEIMLTKNQSYFKEISSIDDIVMKTFSDQNIMNQALQFQAIDLIASVNPLHVQELKSDRRMTVLPYDALSYVFIGLNNSKSILKDKNFRQAIAFALDKEEMLKSFFNNTGHIISGPFPPTSWAYNMSVLPTKKDLARSQQLMAASEYERMKRPVVEFLVPLTGEQHLIKRVSLAIQSYLSQVGIKLALRYVEWNVWKKKVFEQHDYDMTIASWNFDDAANIKTLFHSKYVHSWQNNFVQYQNFEVDELLNEAESTNDFLKKQSIYHKLHAILANEMPYVFLWSLKHHAAHTARLEGVTVEPQNFFNSVAKWSLKDERGVL